MASHTGLSRFPLFLLCCVVMLPSSDMVPTFKPSEANMKGIMEELKSMSKDLLQSYQEQVANGVHDSKRYRLPCMTSSPKLPDKLNGSAILSYFLKIHEQPSVQPYIKNHTTQITQQLQKLYTPDNVMVPMPKSNNAQIMTYDQKCFFLAIFKQFSTCMDLIIRSTQRGTS